MISDIFIILTIVAIGAVMLLPRVANNSYWRATITPLASIIGSGFLILGPILNHAYGGFAPLVMALLCVVAYLYGSAIRANIKDHTVPQNSPLIVRLEGLSSWILAFAYVISVAYYLNLFGTFGVRLTDFAGAVNARLLTSGIFILILLVGWTRGFSALERMEQVSVGLKLAIIAGLIVGLAIFTGERAAEGALLFNPAKNQGWAAITLAFGLIVTIQGFETSRYLGDEYDSKTRVSSMRFAQFISSAIYVIYILLISYVFPARKFPLSETAIIDMMQVVAPILPALLVVAALSAQFSAAIADTEGSGGLVSELTKGRIKPRLAYALLVAAGLTLTWSVDIFVIVAYASRAFALYYALQSIIAMVFAWRSGRHGAVAGYGALAALGFAITVFGTPVEG